MKNNYTLNKTLIVRITAIALLGLVIYSNTLNVPFVFDDERYIVHFPVIKDIRFFLDEPAVREYYEERDLNRPYIKTRFTGFLSFWANYKINGLDVTGYHMVNIAVHVANALLVYALVVMIFRTPFMAGVRLGKKASNVAFLSALLFISHPIHTEAVNYVTQRSVLLAASFYLLCCVFYMKSRLSAQWPRRHAYYLLAVLAAVLAMKSKENSFFPLPLCFVNSCFSMVGAERGF